MNWFYTFLPRVAALAACCIPAAAQAQVTIPCTYARGMAVVEVRVNEAATAHLLVDTGAQVTTFSAAAAERLMLPASSTTPDSSVFKARGTLQSLRCGALRWDNPAFAIARPAADVWSATALAQGTLDGSIGIDLLAAYSLGFDLAAHQPSITLWAGGRSDASDYAVWFRYYSTVLPANSAIPQAELLPPGTLLRTQEDGSHALLLPPAASLEAGGAQLHNPLAASPAIAVVRMYPQEGCPYRVDGMLDTCRLPLDLDTGTTHLVLPAGFSQAVKPAAHAGSVSLRAVDSSERAELFIYRSVHIADFTIPYPSAMEPEGHSRLMRHPTAGMGLFDGCRFILDFPHQRLYLAHPLPDGDAPRRTLAELGVFITETGSSKRIAVGEGSPAQHLGIRDGDVLLGSTGVPLARPDESVTVTRDNEDPMIKLTVRSAGGGVQTEFEFPLGSGRQWSPLRGVVSFPKVPPGFNAARRFPDGGILFEKDGSLRVVRPGGSVLYEAGRYYINYQNAAIRSFKLNLQGGKFRVQPAATEPGNPPMLQAGQGAIWVGGVGWIIGPLGEHLSLDGFRGELRAGG